MPSNGYRWCVSSAPAAAQVIALLQLLAGRPSPQPAATLARELGLPRSTTYRLLGVLKDAGFVTHSEETRRWGLGIAAYELGSAYSRQQPLQRMARAVMTRLAESTGQAAHLGVLHGNDVVYVIEERVAGRPSLVSDVGVRLPASLTATGLAILAALPAAQVRAFFPSVDAFVQRHGVGPTSLSTLRPLLSQTRTRGYAVEEGFVTPGMDSVATPVLDHSGHPVAAVAVTAESAHLGPEAREALATHVRLAAEEISRRVGRRERSAAGEH